MILTLSVALSPLFVLGALLVFIISLVALLFGLIRRHSSRAWDIVAFASFALILALSGMLNAVYGPSPSHEEVAAPSITGGPAQGSSETDGNVAFTWTAGSGGSYECSLDSGRPSYSACTSPKDYIGLPNGSYTFRVRQTGAARLTGAAATRNFSVSASAQTFPGIRWWPVMGVYQGANRGWTSDPTLIDDQYAFYIGGKENRYLDLGDGDNERYWFVGGQKMAWRDMLVDESLAPSSRAQARDPNWFNYKWNHTDIFEQMLDNSRAVAQNKAKMDLFIATTATSEKNPIPTWVLNDPRTLTWRDGQGKDHLRLDKDAAWHAMSDFLVAATKHYGNDPRIASLTIGEYYTNADRGGMPADINLDAYRANIKNVWSDVVTNAPRDANGNRLAILQSNPITSGGFVTAGNMANIGVGASGSDPKLFNAPQVDNLYKQLYGVMPTQHQVNAGMLVRGDPITWDGTPNPWGFTKGQTTPIRYEYVAWYYDDQGVVPRDSLLMRDYRSLHTQWYEAYDQFGPNGTLVSRWGQIPDYP